MTVFSLTPPDAITITGCEGCNQNCDECFLYADMITEQEERANKQDNK